MRVIVATICKDEEAHVDRWAESCSEADAAVLGDTGSTDETVIAARARGVTVHKLRVRPWRFDDARNALMAVLPDWEDAIVVTLDADEILVSGWRTRLEQAAAANPEAARFGYRYIWNWVAGKEGIVPNIEFRADRCVSRYGWRWRGPCHEVLVPANPLDSALTQQPVPYAGFVIEHHADNTKERSSYLDLLQVAVHEEPHNPRQAFYLGREYYFRGQWGHARAELVRFLEMPEATWRAEKAAAWRLIAKMDDDPERWFLRAVAEDTARREAWVDLADWYLSVGRVEEAAGAANRALSIQVRGDDYLTEAHAWDDAHLRAVAGWAEEG